MPTERLFISKQRVQEKWQFEVQAFWAGGMPKKQDSKKGPKFAVIVYDQLCLSVGKQSAGGVRNLH